MEHDFPEDFAPIAMVSTCVLRPGERKDSAHVVEQVGATVVGVLHWWYEMYRAYGSDSMVPDLCRDEWTQYLRIAAGWNLPPEPVRQRLHLGHATFFVPEERKLVTPGPIDAAGALVGEREEIIAKIRMHEAAGLRELVLLPTYDQARAVFLDFSREIIARC